MRRDDREWYRRRNANNYRVVSALKLERGCMDCGFNAHPAALEFDHVSGEKSFDVAEAMVRRGLARIMEEIEKCEVVCANCHAIRTAERRSSAA